MTVVWLTLAAIASGTPAYPARPVLDEFKQVCMDPASLPNVQTVALQRGWQPFAPKADSTLRKLMDSGRKLLGSVTPTPQINAYWKNVGGRRLEMTLLGGRAPLEGVLRNMTNCNIYDFAASGPLETAVMLAWAGRAPTKSMNERGMVIHQWAPGLASLPSQTRIGFIPNIPERRAVVPFTGLGLISSFFEKGE